MAEGENLSTLLQYNHRITDKPDTRGCSDHWEVEHTAKVTQGNQSSSFGTLSANEASATVLSKVGNVTLAVNDTRTPSSSETENAKIDATSTETNGLVSRESIGSLDHRDRNWNLEAYDSGGGAHVEHSFYHKPC